MTPMRLRLHADVSARRRRSRPSSAMLAVHRPRGTPAASGADGAPAVGERRGRGARSRAADGAAASADAVVARRRASGRARRAASDARPSALDACIGRLAMLRLYNTLTRRKSRSRRLRDNTVRMYTCGLTVYARGHIGNFRTFVCVDVLRRTLKYLLRLPDARR